MKMLFYITWILGHGGYASNPRTQEAKENHHEFEANLGYKVLDESQLKQDCSSLRSVTVIIMTKSNVGREIYFILHFQVTVLFEGTQGRHLKAGTQAVTMEDYTTYCFVP